MSAESGTKIAVLIGSHGEEMKVGGRLVQKLEDAPIPGVRHRIAHPEAVAAGVRFLDTTPGANQIMARYPGDPNGNPEERAAYANLQWLQRVKPSVVFDIHESTTKGSYIAMGEKVSQVALASSRAFGYDKFVVDPSSFANSVPNSICVENSLAGIDPEVTAQNLYRDLKRLASIVLPWNHSLDLTKTPYNNDDVFYQKFEIYSTNTDGKLVSGLEQLEEIPARSQFSLLTLSAEQRASLGIPPEAIITYGSWNHDNMSNQIPERLAHTTSRVPRRKCFGSFMVKINPPVPTDDGYLVFERENNQGLLKLEKS